MKIIRCFMRWLPWLLLLVLAATPARAAGPETGKEKLRQLARLPRITINAGMGFDAKRGFIMMSEPSDPPAEIAALQKELGGSGDAERHFRLAELYYEIKADKQAETNLSQAVALFRRQAELQPQAGLVRARLGAALALQKKDDEAVSVIRAAVRLAPTEWKCQVALGKVLNAHATDLLMMEAGKDAKPAQAMDLFAAIIGRKLTPAQLAELRQSTQEAARCFDRAVALAPQEPEVYLQRGVALGLRSYLDKAIAFANGEEKDPAVVAKAMFTTESQADFLQVTRLRPKDYRAIAIAAWLEAMIQLVQAGKSPASDGPPWSVLPDKSRRSITAALAQLENLAQDPDARLAAGAAEAMALFEVMILGNQPKALASLRRAVALDPAREQSWDMLTGLLAGEPGTSGELLSVCEARVKKKDSARNRIMLAKACAESKQLDKAEAQVRAALKQEPRDFTANLALAALLLKQKDDGALAQAARRLDMLDQIQERDGQQTLDLILTRSIHLALMDDVEAARKVLRQVLATDKDNEEAKEIMAALWK